MMEICRGRHHERSLEETIQTNNTSCAAQRDVQTAIASAQSLVIGQGEVTAEAVAVVVARALAEALASALAEVFCD